MKLSNIILATTAASITFLTISNREKIAKEAKETKQIISDIQTSRSNIQEQLAIIQSFQKPLQDMITDFQHKTRVYQQSIAGNIQEIQAIKAKYTEKDTFKH